MNLGIFQYANDNNEYLLPAWQRNVGMWYSMMLRYVGDEKNGWKIMFSCPSFLPPVKFNAINGVPDPMPNNGPYAYNQKMGVYNAGATPDEYKFSKVGTIRNTNMVVLCDADVLSIPYTVAAAHLPAFYLKKARHSSNFNNVMFLDHVATLRLQELTDSGNFNKYWTLEGN